MGKHKPKEFPQQTLQGIVRELNLSPKGTIQGALINTVEGMIQVNLNHDHYFGELSICQVVSVDVTQEPSIERHGSGEHPVFRLISIKECGEIPGESLIRVKGKVRRLNYALHGERNGIVLDTGDFVHLKPDGMKKASLAIGQQVEIEGTARLMTNGCRAIEAANVNGMALSTAKSK